MVLLSKLVLMAVDVLLTNGTIVNHGEQFSGDVAIDGETIAAVGALESQVDAETVIDVSEKVVIPGVVDPHVHIDEVPENRAGTYRAETAAAVLGGVTTIIDFAFQGGDRTLSDDSSTLLDGVEHKRSKADGDAYVDYSFHAVPHREEPETFDEFAAVVDAGVPSFKMFMSTYEVGVSTGFLVEAFEHIAAHDGVAVVHTEDPDVCEALTEKLKREGKGHPRHYPDSRPDYAEAMAAEDAVRLAQEMGVKYYGVHTTSRKAAAVIDQFRTDGSQVRAETCTHYTVLDRSVHEQQLNYPKIAPPLRTPDDIEAMFEYLETGTLSVISTDHSVYHREYKAVDDWWDSPFGANSIQVSLPILHDELVCNRDYSYSFLVEKLCRNPARTFGMPQKGTLEPGTDADIVVLDPETAFTVDSDRTASNAEFSIYEGREGTGAVTDTFVRGQRVVADGELVGEPAGEFVARDPPSWEH